MSEFPVFRSGEEFLRYMEQLVVDIRAGRVEDPRTTPSSSPVGLRRRSPCNTTAMRRPAWDLPLSEW